MFLFICSYYLQLFKKQTENNILINNVIKCTYRII